MGSREGRINIGLEVAPFSEVPPSTLILFENSAGVWFKQHKGVVGPEGQTPAVFGNPEVDIYDQAEYEPSIEAERWRCKNRGQVAVLNALTNDYNGDSHPGDARFLSYRLEHQGQRLDEGLLDAMIETGLVVDGWTNPGLSINLRSEKAYMLTANGMAQAVRKGVGQEFEAGRLQRMLFRVLPESLIAS